MSNNFTYGCELEWSDVDKRISIPEELGSWDWEDTTIVNSDGHANDPKAKNYFFGGEINTKPTDTISEQIKNIGLLSSLLSPKSYYRANLHIHVGMEGLTEDLEIQKKLLRYIKDNDEFIYHEMLFRPEPTKEMYPDPNVLKAAKKFHRQQVIWAKKSMASDRVEKCLAATTVREFYEGHFLYSEKHKRIFYHLSSPRAGINLRSLHKNGTVEFRCWPGTTNLDQIEDAMEFCREFMDAALNNPTRTSREIYESRTWNFPQWQEFIYDLEVGYHDTKVDH